MTGPNAILPLSLAGPGNQICGIKEAMILAEVLNLDLVVPPIIPHYTVRQDSPTSHLFSDVFDLEHFAAYCETELRIHLVDVTSRSRCFNIMMRNDESSTKQAMQYLQQFKEEMQLSSGQFEAIEPNPYRRLLSSPSDIKTWYRLMHESSGFDEGEIFCPIGIFNNVKLGGIKWDGTGSVCPKNHCLNCPPNQDFIEIYRRVSNAFLFNAEIRKQGDELIENNFGAEPFLAFHLRVCDLPNGRTFAECYGGHTEQEVAAALHEICALHGIAKKNIFVAAPPQLFSAISDLNTFHKNGEFTFLEAIKGSHLSSLVEQYICTRGAHFIRSYTNTPDVAYKPHSRSSWSELVESMRHACELPCGPTIDDVIQRSSI